MKSKPWAPTESVIKELTRTVKQGNFEDATVFAETITRDFPKHSFAWKILGIIYLELERYQEALESTKKAIALLPSDAAIHNNLGIIQVKLHQFHEAELSFRKALQISPDYPKALVNLASILRFDGRLTESEACCRRALKTEPRYETAHISLGNALELQNRLSEAQRCYETALQINPNNPILHSDLLHLYTLDVAIDPKQLYKKHVAFGAQFELPLQAQQEEHCNGKDPERQLRVGFVTGDLYDHALANFLEPIFKHLALKPDLLLHIYYTRTASDAVTERVRSCVPRWQDVSALNDSDLAIQIRKDGIDILVDLAGHTALNRLLTFALKPAPLQISWLGHLGTTGLQAIDYYVSDAFFLPREDFSWQFTEKLIHLPVTAVFEPNALAPDVNSLPALHNSHITFGSFNRLNKVNDAVIVLWAMLLKKLPDSRLVLGGIPAEFQAGIVEKFENAGVSSSRLTFFTRMSQKDYLAWHHLVDLCLDTFPCGGGATVAHAAWMGVPTLCLAGESPANRFGASEMQHLGLDEFVATSIEGFLEKGIFWAAHIDDLANVRTNLRVRFSESPLGQPERFVDNFNTMLRTIWHRWCDNLAPLAIDITDAPITKHPCPSVADEPSAQDLARLDSLYHLRKLDEANSLARRLIDQYPEHGFARKILGTVLRLQGKLGESLAVHRQTAELRSSDYEAHFNLACELHQQGQLDDAVKSYINALGLQPNNAIAYSNLGNIFKTMGLSAQAETFCRQAIALQPNMANAQNNLGNALHGQGKLHLAQASYQIALKLKPDWAECHNNLAITLKDMGYWDEAKKEFCKALELKPDWAAAYSNLLYCLSQDVHTSPEALFCAHQAYGNQYQPALQDGWLAHRNNRSPSRELHIGFVSADFYDHAMANFLEPLFESLAKQDGLVLHAFYNHIYEDSVTKSLRCHFDDWDNVSALDDEALALHIRNAGIDILFDLSGHTAHNRLLSFARKPAPIQVSWLGYLGTTGLTAMDYYLCDTFWVPPGVLDWQFTEKAAYLPSAIVFQPSKLSPAVNALPASSVGYLTFGSFNRANKLNASTIALWCMLLRSLPTSRMVFGGISSDSQEAILGYFYDEGIALDRLDFHPRSNLTDYLALHHQVDFCLDAYPYGGGATTAHAAWMGVPTLSLAGDTPTSRFGATLTHHLGLGNFIADSIEDYIHKAQYWAEHIAELAEIRVGLRDRFNASPLGQPDRLAGHLSTMLRIMWQRWCDNKPTIAIHIPNNTLDEENSQQICPI